MRPDTRADIIISEFGSAIGLSGLRLNEQNYCCLTIDSVYLNLEYDERNDQLMLYASLGMPTGDRSAIYAELLHGNFFWHATAGATLSLERETGAIVLLDRLALERLDLPAFQSALERFVDTVEVWRVRLGRMGAEPVSTPLLDNVLPFSYMVRV